MSTMTIYAKGPRALMLNDTAGIDSDGIVRAWVSKVATIPHLRMAITSRGAMLALPALTLDLASQFASFDEMVAHGEDFIRDLFDRHSMQWAEQTGGIFELDVALVGWSTSRRQCEAHAISSLDYDGCPAFTFQRHEVLMAPVPPREALIGRGLMRDGYMVPMAPEALLMGVLEEQRRYCGPIGDVDGAPEVHIVGGQVVATEITEAGITQRIVKTWPDEIGQPIRAEPVSVAPPAVAGMSRQQRRAAEKATRKGKAHAA